jgi:hypothetical protein
VHCNDIPVYIQQDAKLHILFISGNCSTCFGWYLHPSSGAHTIVSTASGICHTITAICRYQLELVWVRCGWRTPPTVHSNRWYHSKHIKQFPDKINCVMLHLVGYILEWNNNFQRLLKFMERVVWMRLVFRHTVVLCNRTTDVKSWVMYKWLDVLVILFLYSVFTKHVFTKILSLDGISRNKTCFQPLATVIIAHSVSLSATELKFELH